MNAIDVKDLHVMLQGFSLKVIQLVVPAGSVMGLIGRNGAGKTTLMKAMLDGYERSSGSIKFYGEPLREEREELLNSIAFLGDEFAYSLHLKIKRLKKVYQKVFRQFQMDTFDAYCDANGIDQTKSMLQLSLGQKKLVELYLALSRDTKLLILDEPMANLDPVVRHKIVQELHTFMLEEDHAILISSHILSDLEKLVDYVAFIDQGEILLQDSIDQLMDQYVILHGSNSQLQAIRSQCISWMAAGEEIQALCRKDQLTQNFKAFQQSADLEMILYHLSEARIV